MTSPAARMMTHCSIEKRLYVGYKTSNLPAPVHGALRIRCSSGPEQRPLWYRFGCARNRLCSHVRALPIRSTASQAAVQQRSQVSHPNNSTAAALSSPEAGTQPITARLYAALNRRDESDVASCFAAEATYENLAVEGVLRGREAIALFCIDSMSAVPDDAVLVLEQQTEGLGSSTAVVWRLVLSSSQMVMSRGIAFYTLDRQGLIAGVTECHEHPVKISQSSLSLVRPLVKTLGGPMIPAMQAVTRTLQQGLDRLLDPLNTVASLLQPPQAELQPQPAQQQQLQAQQVQPAAMAAARSAGNMASQQQQQYQWQQVPGPLLQSSGYGSSRSASISTFNSSSSSSSNSSTSAAPGQVAPAAAGSRPTLPYAKVQAAAARRSAAAGPIAASAEKSAATASEDDGAELVDLSGVWAKDLQRSDTKGYDAMLDVLGLSGLQKVTARLIEGLEIKQTPTQLTVNFLTVVPFFKVTELVPLNAGSTQQGRRDLRRGTQTATAKTMSGGVFVEMSWGQPMAGSLTEEYTLFPDGSLCVHAEAQVGQKHASANTIYTRSKGSKDALLSESRERNGSLKDAMQRQKQQGLSM